MAPTCDLPPMTTAWLTDTVTPDVDRALNYTLLWGLDAVELRIVGGTSERVPHVNEQKLRRRLAEHDVPVAAIVPGLFEGPVAARAAWLNDLSRLDETLQFCARLGCSCVVVSAFAAEGFAVEAAAEALRRAAERAARAGRTLAVLNEAGMACETGEALAAVLTAADHPTLGAAWNPVAALTAGEDPEAGLAALAGRVALVRCANIARSGGAWQPASLAEGAIDWPAQLHRLATDGFDGPLSLEVHLDPKPKWGLRQATDLIRWMRAAQRAGGG